MHSKKVIEANFDGLVGPTHNYAGLAPGNLASMFHSGEVSNPKGAAIQGLEKMQLLVDLGVHQAFLPPLERPWTGLLRRFGFSGSDSEVLKTAADDSPQLLIAACSASAMWTANAATIAPASDTRDGRLHLTPANLTTNLHRAIEHDQSTKILEKIFHNQDYFRVHQPLTSGPGLGDEGAANHTRLAPSHSDKGLHIFAYGVDNYDNTKPRPQKYPARQTLEASRTIARLHQLDAHHCIFLQQNPTAIDAGVFHNDVISTGNENFLLYHEDTFLDTSKAINQILAKYRDLFGKDPILWQVPSVRVSLEDVVNSYLFNSQVVTRPNGEMTLICPADCKSIDNVYQYIQQMISDPQCPITEAKYIDLRGSMNNGGGPACLRLRVPIQEDAWKKLPQGIIATPQKIEILKTWVNKHYRDHLTFQDLSSSTFLEECHNALDALCDIIGLGDLYPFQAERVKAN